MILNPDGFGVTWLFLSLLFGMLSAGIFFKKNKEILAVAAFIAVFVFSESVGYKIGQHFENKLVELAQPVTVKYKRAEPTKNGNKYYLTAIFENGCVSDILVDYQDYREASEGGVITIVPTYQIYTEVLQQNCGKK